MHIETSADARRSKRHTVGGGPAGTAADDRGYLAAAASRLSLWWHGASRPQGLTADTESGAGLQARNEGEDQPPNGDAIPAPPADGYTASDPDLQYSLTRSKVSRSNLLFSELRSVLYRIDLLQYR